MHKESTEQIIPFTGQALSWHVTRREISGGRTGLHRCDCDPILSKTCLIVFVQSCLRR